MMWKKWFQQSELPDSSKCTDRLCSQRYHSRTAGTVSLMLITRLRWARATAWKFLGNPRILPQKKELHILKNNR